MKTTIFVLTASGLVLVAALLRPGVMAPEQVSDQGEPFFPGFRDPAACKAIEIIDYDPETATVRPLKVAWKGNRWVLTSHYDYPADRAAEQALELTEAFSQLKKEFIVSDRLEDHSQYGVLDPMDQSAVSLTGRGKRVTFRDEHDAVLADLIIGRAVDGRPGYYYVRSPGQRRVYATRLQVQPSSNFSDWIGDNLLRISRGQIRSITILYYSIDELAGTISQQQRLTIQRTGDGWKSSDGRSLQSGLLERLVSALTTLKPVNVEPKNPEAAKTLLGKSQPLLDLQSVVSLRRRGFYVTPGGRVLSSEGELVVETTEGIQYHLRFGRAVASGVAFRGSSDEAATESNAGQQEAAQQSQSEKPGPLEEAGRYLVVTVGKASESANAGRVETLNRVFSDWYYVIDGQTFRNLRPEPRRLVHS